MNTSPINTNIPNLNNVSQSSTTHVGNPGNEQKANSNASNVVIEGAVTSNKGDLAQNLKRVNDGLMITSLVDKGINKQKEILNEIKDVVDKNLYDYKIDVDKGQLKQDVLQKLEQFDDLAKNVKYNGQELLDSKSNDKIEVATLSQTVSLNIPSTKDVGDELTVFINRVDFTNENLENIIAKIDNSLDRLDQFKTEFTTTQNQLIENAKSSIADQSREAMEKANVQNRNYSVEAAEFSKSNINSVAGHLVASQANIPQSHGMRLLY